MARRVPHAATRLRERSDQMRFMGYAQWSAVLVGSPAPKVKLMFEWMRRPHPGDIVIETTSMFRRGGPDSIGTLISVEEADDGDKVYTVEPLHRRGAVRWSNASFIRPVITPEQHRMLSSIEDDPARKRAWEIPWCRQQRDVSYEEMGLDETEMMWRFRCRGCGHRAERKRWIGGDVPLCPTCHVPEPPPSACIYCEAQP